MMFSISPYFVSGIHFPLLAVNGCNLLCWNRFVLLSIIYFMFSDVLFIIFMFFHRIRSDKFLQSITMQPKRILLFLFFPVYYIQWIFKLIFNIRNTLLYFIINFLSNLRFTSKHIRIFNYFLHMSDFGHDCEILKN